MAVDPTTLSPTLDELHQEYIDRRSQVVSALRNVRSLGAGEYVSATSVVNPLLDLWAAAVEVDVQVARPVETMLTALMERHLVGVGELREMCDAVEEALHLQTVP